MKQEALKAWLILFGIFILGFAFGTANAAEVYPLVSWSHTSDIRRGPPFNTREEPSQDYFAAGVTITMGERYALDLTHGWKRIRGTSRPDNWETGSQLTVRFYPGKRKRPR